MEISNYKTQIKALAIIGALFFIFGFVTWTNSVLIPYLRIACELNNFQAYLVTTAFYIAYLLMAVPSARLLKIFGFKNGMAVGLIIMAIGAMLFIPAALSRMYPLFLIGLFVQGTGLTVLQTASNPYIVILGPRESAAKRISIMGICNKAAGALAPILLGFIALSNIDEIRAKLPTLSIVQKTLELNALAHRVILPYVVIVVVLILLAILIFASSLPEIDTDKEDSNKTDNPQSVQTSIFQFPHLIIGAIALFVYVGAEVLAGDSIISYGSSLHIPMATAKFFTACTMAAMTLGYIIGIICIPKFISQQKALVLSAVLGIILTAAALLAKGYSSVFCIALLGLANSLMWPAIWPLALADLGKFTKIGSSFLIMGIAGGAVIPLLYGKLADLFSTQSAYIILIPIYVFILYFALLGYKIRRKTGVY